LAAAEYSMSFVTSIVVGNTLQFALT